LSGKMIAFGIVCWSTCTFVQIVWCLNSFIMR
jgi:hypothetical protein